MRIEQAGDDVDEGSEGHAAVAWRRLQRHLWVGAGPAGCLGTIEEGHRFAAIDPSGTVLARCRSLDAAKAALAAAGLRRDAGQTFRAR